MALVEVGIRSEMDVSAAAMEGVSFLDDVVGF